MGTTIHLVRHGEVENPKGVIYGRLPGYHLSERGKRQAEQSADRLKDADIGLIVVEPPRARAGDGRDDSEPPTVSRC